MYKITFKDEHVMHKIACKDDKVIYKITFKMNMPGIK